MIPRIPSTILIHKVRWKIITTNRLWPLNNKRLRKELHLKPEDIGVFGYFDPKKHQIRISRHTTLENQWQTFVHEVLHACSPGSSVVPTTLEERVIHHVEAPLASVIQQLIEAAVAASKAS